MAPPFRVDPVALDGAGKNVAGAVDGWGSALSALNAALSGTAGVGGQDPAGIVFARSYDDSATALLEAMVDVSNGAGRAADGIRASATNYSRAEVAANIDGKGGVPLPAAAPTAHVKTGTPPSAVGSDVGEPAGWFLVEPFVGMIWPDGDSGKCRSGGTAWAAVQAAFTAQQKGLSGAQATVAAQEIPEGPKIGTAFTNIDSAVNEVAGHAGTIAKSLNDYAAKIDTAQNAVKDLLARVVNPMTGVRQVVDWVTGEDDDEIKKIARDISVIVNQFKGEVAALASLLTPIIAAVEMVISTMKSLITMEIEHIGGEIYDTLAPVVNAAAAFGQAMIENPRTNHPNGRRSGPIRYRNRRTRCCRCRRSIHRWCSHPHRRTRGRCRWPTHGRRRSNRPTRSPRPDHRSRLQPRHRHARPHQVKRRRFQTGASWLRETSRT